MTAMSTKRSSGSARVGACTTHATAAGPSDDHEVDHRGKRADPRNTEASGDLRTFRRSAPVRRRHVRHSTNRLWTEKLPIGRGTMRICS